MSETIQITEANKYSTKDITKYVRQRLRAEFKDLKFSVRCEYYSMGSSMHITILESKKVRFVKKYEEITDSEVLSMMSARNDTEAEVRGRIKKLQDTNNYQVNQYHIETDWQFTEEGKKVLKRVLEIANKYNHDNSDIQSDYFDVNYYLHINLGRWDKPFIDGVRK